jgi:putative ABC transport system substrate-binding protein
VSSVECQVEGDAGEHVKKKVILLILSARRSALCLLGVMFLAVSFPAEAQQPAAKISRIGYLALSRSAGTEAFVQGLKDRGYVEGQNIAIEYRFAEGKEDRHADLAAELVQLKVDVIVVGGTAAARAVRKLTKTIPIVIPDSADPVAAELVASLSRPGGNITGLTIMSPKLSGTRLELLKEAFPTISRVVVLVREGGANYTPFLETGREIEVTAQSLGVQVESLGVRDAEIENIFSSMAKRRAHAFILNPNPMFTFQRERIVNGASKSRVPGMYPNRNFVEAGGLMSYAANNADLFRRAASYVDKILRGANPADLPIEQPTKFELVINLKTAKEMELKIPPQILMWADEVIK